MVICVDLSCDRLTLYSQKVDARWASKAIHSSLNNKNMGNTEDEIHEKDLFQVIIHNKHSQNILSTFHLTSSIKGY